MSPKHKPFKTKNPEKALVIIAGDANKLGSQNNFGKLVIIAGHRTKASAA